jgi:hypothetical protein
MSVVVPAIALARGIVAPDNKEVLWEDISNMSLPFYERIKSYDSNTLEWRMVTQLPLELLNELKKVDGDNSGLDANFLQGKTVNDIIQLAKDGSFALPEGFIFIGNSLGNAEAKALSGDATLQPSGSLVLATSGVTAGTYNLASLTIDAKGRVISASSYTITVDDIPELPQSKITDLVSDLSGKENVSNKENSVIDTSTTKYPTVNLLKIGLDGKQDTLVSGTNIKTINSESLLGSGNIEIISENIATNDLTQTDATREYEVGSGNRTLKFKQGAQDLMQIRTISSVPTMEIYRNGNHEALRVTKTSGTGSAMTVQGGTLEMSSQKITGLADPSNPQDGATKAYVDANNTNLANTNLTQTAGQDREYNLNARKLTFIQSLELNENNNKSLTQLSQAFTTSVNDSLINNNSIAPLLDATTLDLYWKYKNNMGVVTDLFAKADKSKLYGGLRYTLVKPNGTQAYYNTLNEVRLNWADGDVLHQFADETDITYVNVSGGYHFIFPSISWNGNGYSVKVSNILTSGEAYVVNTGKTCYFSNVKLYTQGNNIISGTLVLGTLYNDNNTIISIDIENNKSSANCLTVNGIMYGGNVLANGDGEVATFPQQGIGGTGTCFGVTTRGFQSGTLTNFFGGSTTYSVATNYRNVYCNFGALQIGNGKYFDHCYIYSTRNNNGGASQSVFVARNCTIIHVPTADTHTFYNIANITMIECMFISSGYLCATFGSSGPNLIQGGYHAYTGKVNYGAHNYGSLLTISDCTIESISPSATTDVLLLNNVNATNVKINNVTFRNAGGRSDIRTIPANNVEWKNCRFSKGSSHISVSSGTLADAYNNNPARLSDPKGYLNNTGNGNWFMYVPMTTAERDALTSVSKNFTIENTTTNFLQVYNGSTWKDLLDLT